MTSRLRVLPLLLGLLAAAPRTAAAASAGDGETLFREKCAACHTIGEGDRVGPDLRGVAARRDRAWLTRWLLAPDRLLAEGDPLAADLLKRYVVPMPNLGLTEAGAAALVAYLEAAGAGAAADASAPRPAVAPLPAGDPAAGKDLFTGVRRLRSGGPPCMACHSVGGIGALGGGALGPDLTAAYSKFGADGLASILAAMPFPTMNPIFGSRPLTAEEQAHLRAFLQQTAVSERPPRTVAVLAGLATAGAVLFLGLANLVWRRRLTGVRRPLVTRG